MNLIQFFKQLTNIVILINTKKIHEKNCNNFKGVNDSLTYVKRQNDILLHSMINIVI